MNQILTDEEVSEITGIGFEATGRAIEQATLNKLSEQKPVNFMQRNTQVVALYDNPAPSVPEWQPIETAPKRDGVLISIGNSVIRAMFIPEFTLEDNGNYLGDSSYKEENDTYYWPEGWYEWNDHEDTHWLVDEQPTHWMPLPKPPSARSE